MSKASRVFDKVFVFCRDKPKAAAALLIVTSVGWAIAGLAFLVK